MTLIDSDVLIWSTRGHQGARVLLAAIEPWRISIVTYMELLQGCRDRVELDRLKRGLLTKQTEIVPITPAIGDRAAQLIEQYALSHSPRLADALIASTALEHRFALLTANTKHFGAVQGLELENFQP